MFENNNPFDAVKNADPEASSAPPGAEAESVWTYRGYHLRSSEFTTAMVHYYRAEVQRANMWRQRLDTTTNWAVITTGAAISIAFSQAGHHGVIILTDLLITLFLYIEARRYRYYELWSSRLRLLETDFFACMLVPPFHPAADWAESLAESLLHPSFPISMLEAVGRRLRRNYIWLHIILGLAWLGKTALLPSYAKSWNEFYNNASVGALPGWIVLSAGVIYVGIMVLLAVLTAGLQQATGEVLPRFSVDGHGMPGNEHPESASQTPRAWFRMSHRRQQLMAVIITACPKEVSQHILGKMGRGLTALNGTGMYTGESRGVLICALTVTEVNLLKTLVNEADPKAFMIVLPASEVLGRGFMPLQQKA